ncbi:hypothetical protein [Rhizobium sp. BK176]|uniref:hypothetical protein n=1 Tax=Rhizobium sp. BK176 TaxID=2587071 RepID=UPI002167DF86|nr:hypothetical protein [Rhizobium sp. BK176]MCS4089978.1 hypothetical protein [Rhizobium sp. BK176]
MSYRKIEVNGTTYEYVVGRSHVKIRGPNFSKVLTKAEVGQPIGDDRYVVSPANIKNIVLGRPGAQIFVCRNHGAATTTLSYDPYDLEIYGKKRLMMDCGRCLDELGWDI